MISAQAAAGAFNRGVQLNVPADPRFGMLYANADGAVRLATVFWPDVSFVVETMAQGGKRQFALHFRSGTALLVPLQENSDELARGAAAKAAQVGLSLMDLSAARAIGQARHDQEVRGSLAVDVGGQALHEAVAAELDARKKAGTT